MRPSEAALLDAFPAHIAILDSKGLIVSVNREWCNFASAKVYRVQILAKV